MAARSVYLVFYLMCNAFIVKCTACVWQLNPSLTPPLKYASCFGVSTNVRSFQSVLILPRLYIVPSFNVDDMFVF